jgi:23S rRNA pseudouridine2605 synthase
MTTTTLLKALIEAGTGSRRNIAESIMRGKVKVNGKIIDNLKHPVEISKDNVTIDNRTVDIRPKKTLCLMLHKPKGVLSATRDERGQTTVMDLLPEDYRNIRLYPAGRLDKDTTGLLLLTNDGSLTYKLTHPKFQHEKEYMVHIEGKLRQDEIARLEKGIQLEDGVTAAAKVKEVTSPPYNYSLTIHEGRKRQVRRMFERLHHPVIDLKRVRIGGLRLGNLKESAVRELSRQEIEALLRH